MILKRFNEYSNNSEDMKFVPFNDNETKYFKDFTNIIFKGTWYVINSCRVQKLDNGEYFIPSQNVKCSTIQSLIKYTKQVYDDRIKWFKELWENSKKISIPAYTLWYYNGKLWAAQDETYFHIIEDYYSNYFKKDYYPSGQYRVEGNLFFENEIFKYTHKKYLSMVILPELSNYFDKYKNISESAINVDNFIPLNNNEIKYLSAKGKYNKNYNFDFVNGKRIKKLYSGEFYVVYDEVKCSTIQSLLKYTKAVYDRDKKTIDNLINNSEKIINASYKNYIFWSYNGYIWAAQYMGIFFVANSKYFSENLNMDISILIEKRLRELEGIYIAAERWDSESYNEIIGNIKSSKIQESVDKNEDEITTFNNNELKYMSGVGILDKVNLDYFLNCKEVCKLVTDEYLVVNDNIKCNTIQSLMRYTKDEYNKNTAYVDNILVNSKIKQIPKYPNYMFWFYNDILWGLLHINMDFLRIDLDIFSACFENWSQEVKLFFNNRMKTYYKRDFSTVSWNKKDDINYTEILKDIDYK